MNIQRFIASTSREALSKARMTFGDGTVILSNRPIPNGVEVMATGEETLAALNQIEERATQPTAPASPTKSKVLAKTQSASPTSQAQVEADADQLSMSTLSFQDYVRERMLRRRQIGLKEQTVRIAPDVQLHSPAPRKTQINLPTPPSLPAAAPSNIAGEIQAMKDLIEDRFNTLTWLGQTKQNPMQASLMLKLLKAGFSPMLGRTILERLPAMTDAAMGMRWLMDVLERNIKTDALTEPLHQEGGAFALIGSTGVGKTTTAAKLAGLCARTHGPASVGLITLDTYRVGAHEQLRHYGRMLGVVAHLAHDQAALQDLLNLLANKKMILIDTTGLAPHDPRKSDMLGVLDLPSVKRVLVLNASGHGDTLEDVVTCFKSNGPQQTILSKVDEAVKLGPVLDATIRHQLVLRGITNGQKVPEDYESAVAAKLVRLAMRTPAKSAFDPQESDLGFIFNASSPTPQVAGSIYA